MTDFFNRCIAWIKELDWRALVASMVILGFYALACGLVYGWVNEGTPDVIDTLYPVLATLAGILAFLLVWAAYRTRPARRHFHIIGGLNRPRGYVVFAASMAILTTLIIALVGNYLKGSFLANPEGGPDPSGMFSVVANTVVQSIMDPGGLLAVTSGVLAFTGLFVAARQLQEYRQVILRFPEFANRMMDIIKEAEDDEDDYTRLLAFTPIPGSLALEKSLYRRVNEAIYGAFKVSMIILDKDDLSRWLWSFENKARRGRKQRVIGDDIEQAVREAEELVRLFDNPAVEKRSNFVFPDGDRSDTNNRKPLRLVWEQFPGYYIVANERRAVVVCPLFFPLPAGSENGGEGQHVDMVGFETSDPKSVETLHKLFDLLRAAVHNPSIVLSGDLSSEGEAEGFCENLRSELQSVVTREHEKKLWLRVIGRLHSGDLTHIPPAGP